MEEVKAIESQDPNNPKVEGFKIWHIFIHAKCGSTTAWRLNLGIFYIQLMKTGKHFTHLESRTFWRNMQILDLVWIDKRK